MLFSFSIIILIFRLVQAQAQDSFQNELPEIPKYGQEIVKELKSSQNNIYLSINTESIISQNEKDLDIIITVVGLNPGSDPNIYISKNLPLDQVQDLVKSCMQIGSDTCTITNQDMMLIKQFYVLILCTQYPCKLAYSINLQYEYKIKLNQTKMIYFSKQKIEDIIIFSLDIQYILDFTRIEAKCNIYISLQKQLVQNPYVSTFPLQMKIIGNKNIENYEQISQNGWQQSKILNLAKLDIFDVKDLKIVIQAGKSAVAKLSVFQQKSNEFIYLNTLYEEILTVDIKTNFYTLSLNSETNMMQNLNFLLTPYSGSPLLYIHCGQTRPYQLSLYKWQNTVDNVALKETRVIQSIERQNCQFQNQEIYYLAVFSESFSTYTIQTQMAQNSSLILEIDRNMHGILYQDQIINYLITIYEDKSDFHISLGLHNHNTHGYFWVQPYQCNQDQCEIQQLQFEKPDEVALKVIGSNERFLIKNKPQNCLFQNFIWKCTFNIALFLDPYQHLNQLEYEIIAVHSNSFITLKENQPIYDMVEIQHFKKFQMPIQILETVECALQFILTSISGQQRLLIDKKMFDTFELQNEQIEFNNFEYQSLVNLNYIYIPCEKIRNQSYYVYVYGQETGFFSIYYLIQKNNSEIQSFTQLRKDLVQDVYINDRSKFYFMVNLKKREDIYFKIIAYSGTYNLFLSNNQLQLPSREHHEWSIEQTIVDKSITIFISGQDPSYSLFMRGMVELTQDIESMSDQHFRIVYHTNNSVYEIFENINFYNQISSGERQILQFRPSQFATEYIISFDVTNKQRKNLTIYYLIGLRGFPDEKENDGLINAKQSTLKINFGLFQECQQNNKNQSCQLYMSIQSYANTTYSVIISSEYHEHRPVRLIEGQGVTIPVPSSGHYINFYYHVQTQHDLTIYQFSRSRNAKISGTISNYDQIPENLFNPDYIHQFSVDDSFNLKSSQIKSKFCIINSYPCILILRVTPLFKEKNNSTITIKIIQDSILRIEEGVSYYGSVRLNEINYYTFDFKNKNKTIFISLQGIGSNSDTDIYVSFNSTPNKYKSEYSSSNLKEDYIAINNEQRLGIWVIGVFGYNLSKYSLQYSTGDFMFFNIQNNQQFQVDLEKGQNAYFMYYHDSYEGFQIQILLRQGIVDIGVLDNHLSPIQCFQGEWVTDQTNGTIEIKSVDPKFCTQCYYMIALCSKYGASLNLMVNINGDSILLKMDSVLKKSLGLSESQYYIAQSTSLQRIELTVLCHSGQLHVYISDDKNMSNINSKYYEFKQVGEGDIVTFILDSNNIILNANDFIAEIKFFILVEGVQKLNIYSISISEYQYKSLSYGQPTILELQPSKLYVFKVDYDRNKFMNFQSTQLSIYLYSKTLDFSLLTKQKIIEIETVQSINKTFQQQIYQLFDQSNSSQHYIYSFSQLLSGKYLFKLKNKYNESYKAILLVESGEIITLLSGQEYLKFSNRNQHYQFEYHVVGKKNILIQLNQCVGRTSIKAYKSYKDLSKDENELMIYKSGQNYGVIPFEGITLYLKAHSYKLEEDINSFILQVKSFQQSQKFPQDYMSPGGFGNIRQFDFDEQILIQVERIQCDQNVCPDLSNSQVQYILYVSNNLNDVIKNVQCKAQQDNQNLLIFSKSYQDYISSDMLQDFYLNKSQLNNMIWVQVKIILKVLDDNLQYYETNFYYNMLEIFILPRKDKEKQQQQNWIWIIFGVMFTITAMGIIYKMCQRYNSIVYQLNYVNYFY